MGRTPAAMGRRLKPRVAPAAFLLCEPQSSSKEIVMIIVLKSGSTDAEVDDVCEGGDPPELALRAAHEERHA